MANEGDPKIMANDKKPLPGEHGDSIDYRNLNILLTTLGAGIVLGILFFATVL